MRVEIPGEPRSPVPQCFYCQQEYIDCAAHGLHPRDSVPHTTNQVCSGTVFIWPHVHDFRWTTGGTP